MSHSALIRFAPILSAEILLDPSKLRAGRSLYQDGGLTLVKDAPVVIDHDMDRPIGRIEELFRHEDTDGPWYVARCTIDRAPGWVRRGTPASFSFANLGVRQDLGAGERILRALVTEVTVCSASFTAVDPAANVCLFRELQPEELARRAQPVVADLDDPRKYRLISSNSRCGMLYEAVR